MIGYHFIVDGAFSNPLNGKDLKTILLELPFIIGMKILSGPYVVKGCSENPGWTGFVIIDKSHIAIHTFDEGNKISVDVFSCKIFKEDSVFSYLQDKIKFLRYRTNLIERNEETKI